MFSSMFLRYSFRSENSSRKMKKSHCSSTVRLDNNDLFEDLHYPPPATLKTTFNFFPLHDDRLFESPDSDHCTTTSHKKSVNRHVEVKGKRRNKDSASRRVQRAASSCLLHPLFACLRSSGRRHISPSNWSDGEEEPEDEERSKQTEILGVVIDEVFDAVRRAYLNLQDATAADATIAAELRRLGTLRERFRGEASAQGANMLIQAPVGVKIEVFKKNLAAAILSGYGKRCRSSSNNKASCYSYGNVAASPAPELFKATAMQVREASQSFGSTLLSLMRYAHWDIPAAVHSITAAGPTSPTTAVPHAKYALESFVSRKLFQGFDHETFHMVSETSLTFNTEHHRFHCFTQYLEMKSVDPLELLKASPNCSFGKFCAEKYLSVVHPKMEESFFGGGENPKMEFYREFLRLAKSVWLLHLLAFSLDPGPSPFEARRGAMFCPEYMESAVGGLVPVAHNVVGFPLGPGFKLDDGSIIKARVYLVS